LSEIPIWTLQREFGLRGIKEDGWEEERMRMKK
jgi:hypothetical protein